MKSLETFKDPLAKALSILRVGLAIGQTKMLSELVTKKGGEEKLAEAIKQLINAGWSEYEFTDDYSGVRRLDLPDHARTYFKKLKNEYSI